MSLSRTSNYLRGITSGYLLTLLTIVVGIWLTPFTLSYLPREEFAIAILIGDAILWLSLVDLGVSAALRVQIARLSGHSETETRDRLVSTALFAQIGITVLFLLVGSAFIFGFVSFFRIPPALVPAAKQTFMLFLFGTLVAISTQVFSALLTAYQQIHIDNLLGVLNVILRTILTVVMLRAGYGLVALAFANLAAKLLTASLAIWRVYRLLPDLKIRRAYVSWTTLHSTFEMGLWLCVGTLSGIVITSLDKIIAGKMLTLTDVTILSLTGRLYMLSITLIEQLTATSRPMLAQLLGQDKKQEALIVYRYLFILSAGLSIILSLSIFAANSVFLERWVGSQNDGGLWLSIVLAANTIIHCWILPHRAVLTSAMIVREPVLYRCVEGSANLLLSIILAPYLGLIGICLATTICGIVLPCWYLPRLASRVFDLPFGKFIRQDLQKPVLLLSMLAPFALGVRLIIGNHNTGYLAAFLCFTLVFLCGCTLFWFGFLDAPIKAKIQSILALKGKFPQAV